MNEKISAYNNSIDFFKGTIIFLTNFFIKSLGEFFKKS